MEKAMTLELLLAWWNLIYIVPFVLALMYLGLFVFTGITFGDADADADAGFDTDADADMDADADADIDADADHDISHDGNGLLHAAHTATIELDNPPHPEPQSQSPILAFLSFLGLGKIPLSLALMIFLFNWGIAGFALNALLQNWLGVSSLIGVISVPIAFTVACALTGGFAALLTRFVPNDDGKRHRRSDLVGKSGEAIYDIDSNFGMANVRGEAGDLFQIPCRTVNGTARIPKGTRVVIFHYDRQNGVFHVAPFDA
jgi:membrane protein implicated in regulation of membrane protease activity